MSDAARPDRVRPHDLLAHADWARELAAHLVRDPAAADDLAQEALAAAIEKPPEAGRPVRPWLAAVIRNLALARRRGDGRRARRETDVASAAASKASPSAAEVTERLDAHRVLAEVVAELPEPLRATVYLRYYEGLDSSEIARRHSVAAETVRWRLAKALAELRERLDARSPGGRGEWLAALAPIGAPRMAPPAVPAPKPAAPVAAVLTGVLAMATTTKFLLGGAAVVAMIALLWSAETSRTPGPSHPAAVAKPANVASGTAARGERRDAPKQPRRRAEAEPAASAAAETAKPESPRADADADTKSRRIDVRARVLDPMGAAATGSRVECSNTAAPAGADGDADGRVAFTVSAGADAVSFDFVVSAERCATRIVAGPLPREGSVIDLGDVRLVPGGAVEGRVVDTAGAAIAGASVAVASTSSGGDTIFDIAPVASSDADGRFVLRGVPVGRPALGASASGFDSKISAADVRTGEASHGLVIVLDRVDPSVRVRGVVQSPDGAAAPRAQVTYRAEGHGSTSMGTVSVGADGRFDIEGGKEKTWQLSARDADGKLSPSAIVEVRSGAEGIVLRLAETRWAEVCVTRSDGKPAERYAVHLQAADGLVLDRLNEEAHEGGVARIRLPAQPFFVTATAPGCAVASVGPIDPSKVEGRIEVRAATLPGLRGRVTAAGEPVAKARVTLSKVVGAGMLVILNGFTCLTSPELAEGVDTGADGAFDLTLREPGRYVLRAELPGFAAAEAGPFDLTPEAGRAGIAIALTTGGAIEGRVLPADGHSADGVIVGASRGDGAAQTVRTGRDGAFRFDRLTPGQWLVRQNDREIRRDSTSMMSTVGETHFEWSCRVDEGATTHFDVDLREQTGTVVRGEVRVNGHGAADWRVSLLAGTGLLGAEVTATSNVTESGSFRFFAPRAGDYFVCAKSPKKVHVFVPVNVADAEVVATVEITVGQVSVRGAPAGGALVLLSEGPGGRCALAWAEVDDKGAYGPASFPAGRVRLVRASAEERDPRKWETLAEGEIVAGGSVVIEVPVK